LKIEIEKIKILKLEKEFLVFEEKEKEINEIKLDIEDINYAMNEECDENHNWDTDEGWNICDETVEYYTPKRISKITDDIQFDVNEITVRIKKLPFDTGSERKAFLLKIGRQQKVLKLYKQTKYSLDDRMAKGMVHVHAICNLISSQFVKNNIGGKKIKFIQLEMIKFAKRNPVVYGVVEDYLPGKYLKFNNNGDWKTTEGAFTAQAFSHYSYNVSDNRLIVVDLQGIKRDNGYILTDPAIHSQNKSITYGTTDRGEQGLHEFFKTHSCNKICSKLKLPPHTQQKTKGVLDKDTIIV